MTKMLRCLYAKCRIPLAHLLRMSPQYIIIIIITKELIKVMPSQLQNRYRGTVQYNTLSPVTRQGMTAEKVFV